MELLTALLSTALGKAAAGAAIAAVSVGGLHAADVVDVPVPGLEDKPEAVEVEDSPADPGAVVAQTPAEGKATPGADGGESTESEIEGDLEAEDEATADDGTPDDNATFGQDVATEAQAGGDVSDYARTNNPGVAAREDAGTQADDVRRDADAPHGDTAGEQPEDAGTQADTAGEQADTAGAQGEDARTEAETRRP